jgi:peptidylprolyl isomerase
MPFEKGNFIAIDYIGKVAETNKIFDTTIAETAKKGGIHQKEVLYEPQLVVIGEGWVLKALDESLLTLELGKTSTIEIPPEKAFGNREAEKVKIYSLRKLISQGLTPKVGARLEVDGKLAIVRTVGSGRAQLDFNPPLAGKTLIYEVTVQKAIEKDEEKIKALIHRRIPLVNVEKFLLNIKEKKVDITIPEEAYYLEGLQISKRGIFIDIQKFFPENKTVKFIELFKKRKPA